MAQCHLFYRRLLRHYFNRFSRDAEEVKDFGGDTPLGRPAQPEEIAPAFVFFASNVDSSYVTGEVLTLLGGETRAG
jgi:NAD(P)-dependent dehydrogenase (short-subunit alcohol dehydrogenase family)